MPLSRKANDSQDNSSVMKRFKNVFGRKDTADRSDSGLQQSQYHHNAHNNYDMGQMQNALPYYLPRHLTPVAPVIYHHPGAQDKAPSSLPPRESPYYERVSALPAPGSTLKNYGAEVKEFPVYSIEGPLEFSPPDREIVVAAPPESDAELLEVDESILEVDLNMQYKYIPDERRPFWYRSDEACEPYAEQGSLKYLCATCRRIDFGSILRSKQTNEVPPPSNLIVLGPLATITDKLGDCGFCSLVSKIVRLDMFKELPDTLRTEADLQVYMLDKEKKHSRDMYYLYPVRFKDEYSVPGLFLGRNVWQKAKESKAQGAVVMRPERSLGIRVVLEGSKSHGLKEFIGFGRQVKEDLIDVDWIKEKLALCDARSVGTNSWYSYNLRAIDVDSLSVVDVGQGERYVTLSYVWGQVKQLSLTKAQEHTFRQPGGLLPYLSEIPQTIRDAIQLTQDIGERYLWVDALCIIQDDEEDKATLISKMGDIYGKSVLTIQACCGTDANYGLPGVRPGTRKVTQVLELAGGVVMSNMLPGEFYFTSTHWSSRAWTLQEKVLSRRMLMINDDVTYWWCWHTCSPEDEICRHLYWEEGTRDQRFFYFSTEHDLAVTRREVNANFDIYAYIISDYTKRKLTFQRDAEVALKGILEQVTYLFRGKFLYGIPDTEIDNALLWCPMGSTRRRVENGKALFPSWSFLGWDGHAAYPWAVERDFPSSIVQSPLQWRDANSYRQSGTLFSGNEYRISTLTSETTVENIQEQFLDRFSEDPADSWCFVDKTDPQRHWYNRIVGTEHETRIYQFLLPGSHQLRFKTLSAHFTLASDFERRAENYNHENKVYHKRLLDSHGFSAGFIYTPDPETMPPWQRAQFSGRCEFLALSRASVSPDGREDRDHLYAASLEDSARAMGMPRRVVDRFDALADASRDEKALFDNLVYYKTSPWCLFNVMMVERRPDGVAERVTVGRIHVSAFMFEGPEMKEVRLE